ncbi:MAG: sugar phosphate isomerase/epimerase [Planctomycetes bacterium]|nr:sugar phosphate isomerase/epimerase [Planctomycetota bacterium]
MSLDELAALAQEFDYKAICMRASQIGVQSPRDRATEAARTIAANGLKVSMVTGDFEVPRNNDRGPDGLRNITPHLDLAEQLGSDLIRICMKVEDDIPWAQRAADEARERNIRLAHQSHTRSLFETVEGSIRVLRKVDRPNFGIIYEPANWMLSGQQYGATAIRQIKPWLFNVYVQNCRIRRNASTTLSTWTNGEVDFDQIGLWEEGGVDFDEVMTELHAIGYDGYVTVHQAFAEVMPPREAVRKSADFLGPRLAST